MNDTPARDEPSRAAHPETEGEALSDLQMKLAAEAREHRKYLESLMDRVIRTMYIVAGFLVGVAGVLGFKTWVDVDRYILHRVNERVDKLVNREYAERQTNQALRRVKGSALTSYLAIQTRSPRSADRRRFALTDDDWGTLKEILADVQSPCFCDALATICQPDVLSQERKEEVGKGLTDLLVDMNETGKAELVCDLVAALASMKHAPAAPTIINCLLENPHLPQSVQTTLIQAVPALVQISDDRRLKMKAEEWLAREITKEDWDSRELREATLIAGFLISPDAAIPELEKLATSRDEDALSLFWQVMRSALSESPRNLTEDRRTEVVRAIATFLANKHVTLECVSSLQPRRTTPGPRPPRVHRASMRLPAMPKLVVKINRKKADECCSVARHPVLADALFTDALEEGLAVETLGPEEKLNYIADVMSPAIDWGRERFRCEKAVGDLSLSADPYWWCDGFRIRLNGAEERLVVDRYDPASRKIEVRGRPLAESPGTRQEVSADRLMRADTCWQWGSREARTAPGPELDVVELKIPSA